MSIYSFRAFGIVVKSISKETISKSQKFEEIELNFLAIFVLPYWSYGCADVGTSRTNINHRRSAHDNGKRTDRADHKRALKTL